MTSSWLASSMKGESTGALRCEQVCQRAHGELDPSGSSPSRGHGGEGGSRLRREAVHLAGVGDPDQVVLAGDSSVHGAGGDAGRLAHLDERERRRAALDEQRDGRVEGAVEGLSAARLLRLADELGTAGHVSEPRPLSRLRRRGRDAPAAGCGPPPASTTIARAGVGGRRALHRLLAGDDLEGVVPVVPVPALVLAGDRAAVAGLDELARSGRAPAPRAPRRSRRCRRTCRARDGPTA